MAAAWKSELFLLVTLNQSTLPDLAEKLKEIEKKLENIAHRLYAEYSYLFQFISPVLINHSEVNSI